MTKQVSMMCNSNASVFLGTGLITVSLCVCFCFLLVVNMRDTSNVPFDSYYERKGKCHEPRASAEILATSTSERLRAFDESNSFCFASLRQDSAVFVSVSFLFIFLLVYFNNI